MKGRGVKMPDAIAKIMGKDRRAKDAWFRRVGGIQKRWDALIATGKYKVK